MRMTFVTPGRAGGGARMVARIATELIERGHDVRVLYPSPRRNLKGIVRGAYLQLRYGSRDDAFRTFRGSFRAYETLTAELVGTNDVLIGVGVDCVLAIAGMPQQCGVKINHCAGREPWIMDRMLHAWQLPMPRIVSTSHLAREMRDRGAKEDIFVVHYGLDRADYFPSVPVEQRNGVGTVYHGASVKDPVAILAVLQAIHKKRPNTPLYVFGTFPRPRGLPRAAEYVRLTSLAVVRELYSRSLVWFCASRSEGFGLPPLEAMACGCAVVSTDCGGPSDFISSGVNGFLVPVGDHEQLSLRILQLLDDADLRSRFVTASQATLDQFPWSGAIDRFEEALESILTSASVKQGAEK